MIAEACARETNRFTIDGNEALERQLADICGDVRRAVEEVIPARKLEGLLLAGGYGRGEGGVLETADGQKPYNDLDFYAFLRGNYLLNTKEFGGKLRHLGEKLSQRSRVEIELKADSLPRWRRSPVTMFSYDVVMGHKWLIGDDSLFAWCEHHQRAADIPAYEAARLVLNRCSGLLFAAEHLDREDFTADAADFVARNIAKAQLGLGDAVLTMFGRYHWSCVERHQRLKHLGLNAPWLSELRAHHAVGVDFKSHPKRSVESRQALAIAHGNIAALAVKVWLWLESRRLGTEFGSLTEYSFSSVNKSSESKLWRNALINTKCGMFDRPHRYPRERLYHALPLLLWEREQLTDPKLLTFLQKTLHTRAAEFRPLVGAYQELWRWFS